jgi:hypothetical protein
MILAEFSHEMKPLLRFVLGDKASCEGGFVDTLSVLFLRWITAPATFLFNDKGPLCL